MSELVLERPSPGESQVGLESATDVVGISSERFHSWYWLLVPLLALAAYATVWRIGFLADDQVLLIQAHRLQRSGLGLNDFLPQPTWSFYRPLGLLLTWRLGSYLWGYNPLPYHLEGLL